MKSVKVSSLCTFHSLRRKDSYSLLKSTVLLAMLMGSSMVQAQKDSTGFLKRFMHNWDNYKQDRLERGASIVTPFIAPAYSPELGVLFAGGGVWTFKTNPKDSTLLRSSMPFTLGYSTTGAINVQAKLTSYWLHDRIRFDMNAKFRDMPDNYFGIGYDVASTTKKSDSTTAYQRRYWEFNPRLLYQFKKNHFFGAEFDVNSTEGSDESYGVQQDSIYTTYNSRPRNVGLGAMYRYDDRDVPVDAYRGLYFDARVIIYSDDYGSQNSFTTYQLDLRKYFTIKRPGRTLACRFWFRYADGDVPYGEMSDIGGGSELRGYRSGQYRDDHGMMIVAEYRHVFRKKDGGLGKHGVVGWAGNGTIFNSTDRLFSYSTWLPNGGFGYRFAIEPRINVRLDMGFGRNSSGFYFSFNQAF